MTLPEPGFTPGKKRVRMKDVASRAGVSISTVSLVLSGDVRIPEDTARKVLQTVKALEYRPSVLARSLAKRGSRTIAVILPEFAFSRNQGFYYQILEGIHAQTQPAGYKMLVEASSRAFLERRYYLRILKEQSVDGVLYLAAGLQDTFLNEMARENYPFVLLGDRPQQCDLPFVGADEELGAKLAVQHLVTLGHKNIGFIGGSPDLSSGRSREKGFREALSEAGLTPHEKWIIPGSNEVGNAESAAPLFLAEGVTAAVAASDWMAAGLIKGLWSQSVRVPDSFAVVGMDDLPVADLTAPPLTTVRFHWADLASDAVKMLLKWIPGPLHVRPAAVSLRSPELIVRSSCGKKP